MGPAQSPARIPEFLPARLVSCFTTCFVNMPSQRYLVPAFISSTITFAPSWLMVVLWFHLDNELTTTRICSGLLAVAFELACPGPTQLAFHNQPTRTVSL